VKFFYRDDWVKDLKLGDYRGCTTLSCVMDSLLKGTSLYYYIDDSGNIVITNNYEVKISNTAVDKSDKFLPPSDFSGSSENQQVVNRDCWISNNSSVINIKNTSVLEQDKIERFPLLFISNQTDRLKVKYSLL